LIYEQQQAINQAMDGMILELASSPRRYQPVDAVAGTGLVGLVGGMVVTNFLIYRWLLVLVRGAGGLFSSIKGAFARAIRTGDGDGV